MKLINIINVCRLYLEKCASLLFHSFYANHENLGVVWVWSKMNPSFQKSAYAPALLLYAWGLTSAASYMYKLHAWVLNCQPTASTLFLLA